MQVNKQKLEKSRLEFEVTLSREEFEPYLEKGAKRLSEQVKIEGFRPGKVPYDILKQKVGEMSILEEAAQTAIQSTIDEVMKNNLDSEQPAEQPQVEIVKLAPDNDFVYKIKLAILPEVKLGEYKNLDIKKREVEFKEDDLDKTLDQLQEMKAKESVKLSGAEIGDKLNIDIAMFFGQTPVEGGQGKDVTVILGKEYFLPGFDQQLLGAEKNQTKNFSLDYPADHHQKHLAGKKVDFKITIKEVYRREVPVLDDNLAQSLQFKNLEELKKAVKQNITNDKEKKQEIETEKNLMEKLISQSSFGELPENLIENEAKGMIEELQKNVESQGGKFEDYLQNLKKTRDQLLLDFLPDATKRIKIALLLRAVADKEDIKVSPQEVEEKLEELKKAYANQEEIKKNLESLEYKRHLNHAMLSEKIINQLKAWNYADSGKK